MPLSCTVSTVVAGRRRQSLPGPGGRSAARDAKKDQEAPRERGNRVKPVVGQAQLTSHP